MKRIGTILVCAHLLLSPLWAANYGSFVGRVVAEWLPDGRQMKLQEDFAYLDPFGRRWEAPAGSVVDGASIPRIAWSVIGGPFEGNYRNASVIHDVACVQRRQRWEEVHEVFYTAMLASGVGPTKAKIMYAAVYHFGPRWPLTRRVTETQVQVRKKCTIILGQAFCMDVPEQVVVEREIVEMPAAQVGLSDVDFDRIKSVIEARESSAQPLLLEDIRLLR